jgi:hypothetical protein
VKGTRWMPWRQEPMKDGANTDMPRGAVSRLGSGDFRMGQPTGGEPPVLLPESIGQREADRGN